MCKSLGLSKFVLKCCALTLNLKKHKSPFSLKPGITIILIDNLNPERMAKVGFLYRGSDDRAICFYCGQSLCQWGETDVPKNKHIKY